MLLTAGPLSVTAAALLQGGTADPSPILVPLAAALGLAVIVERVIELAKNAFDLIPTVPGKPPIERPARALEPIDEFIARHRAAREHAELEAWSEEQPASLILVKEANDPDDGATLRAFMLQTIALATGIIAAHVAGLRLFSAMLDALRLGDQALAPAVDYVLTGLLVGGGSAPVHTLIRFVQQRSVTVEAVAVQRVEATSPPATQPVKPAPIAEPVRVPPPAAPPAERDEWVEIAYDGGVDREVLETVHRRRANPSLIIYHHTAMHGDSTFQDVVNVIKGRKDSQGRRWLTGYNCVVTGDGGIHPFCRWDRYGNHAAGYNAKSLGIALNGNFETNPAVSCSNPDGRYGRQRPAPAQLESAARVVALWCHVYDIVPDFGTNIIPHSRVADKACPGNNFPTEEYRRLVLHFHGLWAKSERAKDRIEAFRSRPYVMTRALVPAGGGV